MTEKLSDKFKIPDKAQARTSPASNMSHEYEENYYFILYGSVLSNRRPFQQLRAYKRHKENKSKIGQERSSMQQAHYKILMSSAHSMDARKCLHAQKPYPSQAFAHESSKVGERGKREARKTEARRLMERKAAQQNKTHRRN